MKKTAKRPLLGKGKPLEVGRLYLDEEGRVLRCSYVFITDRYYGEFLGFRRGRYTEANYSKNLGRVT